MLNGCSTSNFSRNLWVNKPQRNLMKPFECVMKMKSKGPLLNLDRV